MPYWKAEVKARLAGLSLSPARELEIIEEISQHLQDRYEQELIRGATEEEAQRALLEELNAPELLGRELKQVERRVPQNPVVMGTDTKTSVMGDITQDLRYGLRMLWKNPGFTIVAVLALALGIGANSAIFSVVNTVLLQPLPYKNPGQLVMLWENATHLGFPKDTPSPANFLDWRAQNTVFTGMAAMAQKNFNLTGIGEPERLDGRRVSANLFDVLGVQPRLGRGFLPQEDTPGTHVVILSHGLWQRRFGSDPRIIGQALNLNGESYSVVGVMPRALTCQVATTGRTSFGCQLRSRARKRSRAEIITSKSSRGRNPASPLSRLKLRWKQSLHASPNSIPRPTCASVRW